MVPDASSSIAAPVQNSRPAIAPRLAAALRSKPDITAADGVSVATPGFNPFYGTSAAAPHAAAIAALLKSGAPPTPEQVRHLLTSTAVDIETPGADRDTGAGIVMPSAALLAAGVTPKAFLDAGAPVLSAVRGDGDLAVENYETFSIAVPLTNKGGADATAVSAFLASTTPGIRIITAASAYADIAAGTTEGNSAPYAFRVGRQTPCGTSINFTLAVSYAGVTTAPQIFSFSVPIGGAGTSRAVHWNLQTGNAVSSLPR